MGIFSKSTSATIETAHREKSREEMIAELGAEIAAARRERDSAKADEQHYRATHYGNEKIVGTQFQVRLDAMNRDLANSEIQKRIRRTREANQRLSALCASLSDLKSPGWRVQ